MTGRSENEIKDFKQKMMKQFEMRDLVPLSYFLGIEFKATNSRTVMHQTKYATDLLKKFNMLKCNLAVTPYEIGVFLEKDGNEEFINWAYYRQIVGSLRYWCLILHIMLV